MGSAEGDRGLSVRSLTVMRGGRRVVSDVDLYAPAGEVTALLGPNGAGKSTVLGAIAGLVPSSGRVAIEGRVVEHLSECDRARRVAYVPQRSRLEARLAVEDVVAQGRFVHTGVFGALGPRDRDVIRASLDASATHHLAKRAYSELSGGEQRRVLLARALATEAPVLLLDEPTASLDLSHVLTIGAHLRALARGGRVVLAVLHDLDEVRRVADHAVLLSDGEVVASGPTNLVVANPPVRHVYGVELVFGAGLGYRACGSQRSGGIVQ